MARVDVHNHTCYSNIRLLDAIVKPEDLVDRALELGLKGVAITDHECLSAHIKLNKLAAKVKETNPDFKIILGNEIYLVDERPCDTHYHFILLAKDAEGHKQLRYLSSLAWMNSYNAKGLERVDTLKADLEAAVRKNPGHLIASTACIGGELGHLILEWVAANRDERMNDANDVYARIVDFIEWCKNLFKDDFYLECQPGTSKDQISVNRVLIQIAKRFGIKMIVTCDTHYLKEEDRYIHKAYLNSKGGERETDAFYADTYLKSDEEVVNDLALSGYSKEFVEQLFANSMEIYDKIEDYSLLRNQQIPYVETKEYEKSNREDLNVYPQLKKMFASDDIFDRSWVNQCLDALDRKFDGKTFEHEDYLKELEEEAEVKQIVGDRLGTNMFRYPLLLQYYIDLIWECGSTVGAGRGSACAALNHLLLGITQLDPLEWSMPFFRYMNRDTDGLGDIDIDIAPSKRPLILQKIREQRKKYFDEDLDEQSKENLGCTLIATFGTEGSKSAVLTSCRGYKTQEFPDGIDVDTAQFLASLIPSERGFVWPLHDVVYGNPEKGRRPITTFINEINQYPHLLDIAMSIEGLVKTRSSHASGVIMFEGNPYDRCAFMRTPSGDLVTQFDLHDDEASGMVKLDLLVTAIQDKLVKEIEMLQEYGEIEKDLTLREAYNKYFHPNVIPLNDEKIWKAIQDANTLDLFQLDSDVGRQGAKKVKPDNMVELSTTNALIRLMAADGEDETPMETYLKFKANPNLIEQERDKYHLTQEQRDALDKYTKDTYSMGISQELLMKVLMDDDLCGFSLKEANAARKIVSKKQMNKIDELKKKVYAAAGNDELAAYIWKRVVSPGLAYSFSEIHSTAYSFITFQTAMAATRWNPLYWDTACLIVNSDSLDEDASGQTDYAKIAKAIGAITQAGIKLSLIDINKSDFTFKPDTENNQILYALNALSGVNAEIISQIKSLRPFTGIKDFMNRLPLKKPAMISLIKSGAFDEVDKEWASQLGLEPRIAVMIYYIMMVSNPKTKITLQNMNSLIDNGILPESLSFEKRVFAFNKYLKRFKKDEYYMLDETARRFYNEFFGENDDLLIVKNGYVYISQKQWDKMYKKIMDKVKEWMTQYQDDILATVNYLQFKESWDKYAAGTLSSWEMDSLCFYYHEHELARVDNEKYGIVNFFNLPSEPAIDYCFKRNGRQIPLYKLYRIAGTVIAKNDTRSSISLLTTDGVVNVKFTKEYYAQANRQISEIQPDGTKKIQEAGWFKRGTKLLITGFRRDDTFVAKRYSKTPGHTLYKITEVNGDDIKLESERYGANNE